LAGPGISLMSRPKGSMNVALSALYIEGKKRCTRCKKVKSHDEFVKNGTKSHTIDGLTGRCKECQREVKTQWDRDHPDSKRKQRQDWRMRYPDHVRRKSVEYAATRRARKLGQFIEEVDRDVVYEMHGGMCGICERFIIGKFHVDHVIPLSKGGMHGYVNVQPAHPLCNFKKRDQQYR
jgi:5-methylcytosine-specific restriction endonuclease McrA